MNDTSSVSPARRTLKWAKDEIARLAMDLRTFGYGKNYEVFYEESATPDGEPAMAIVMKNIESPTDDMQRSAYRIVGDLRNALDHACHAASMRLGSPSPKHTNFPFRDTEHDFKRHLAHPKGPHRGIPVQLHAKLLSFAPFWTKEDGSSGDKTLRFLNELANPNKHQIPLETAIIPGAIGIRRMTSGMTFAAGLGKRSNGEVEIMRVITATQDDLAELEIYPAIVLQDSGPFPEETAIELFQLFFERVSEVISEIEAETERLSN